MPCPYMTLTSPLAYYNLADENLRLDVSVVGYISHYIPAHLPKGIVDIIHSIEEEIGYCDEGRRGVGVWGGNSFVKFSPGQTKGG